MRTPDSSKSPLPGKRKRSHLYNSSGNERGGKAHPVNAEQTGRADRSSPESPDSEASELTEYFYALTPDRILEAFREAGIHCQPAVRFLNSLENRVACIHDEEGERWVAKFYRPRRHSRDALLEEHQFIKELRDAGLPVIPPLELKNGRSGTLGSIAGIFFAIFPHRPGTPPDELDTSKVSILGEILARIHTVGSRRPSPHRYLWNPETLGNDDCDVLARTIPPDIWRQYERSARKLIDWMAPRLADTPRGRIHGDFHRGNLLWSSAGPLVVDFDDMTTGPPIQDFWMMVPGRDSEAQALREKLISSYERHRSFDRKSLEMVEPMRAFRYIRYAAWLAARRHDPAFTRVLHDFGTRSYWREELTELEAQLELFM